MGKKKKKKKPASSIPVSSDLNEELIQVQIRDYYSKIELRRKIPKLVRLFVIAFAPSLSLIRLTWNFEIKFSKDVTKVQLDLSWLNNLVSTFSDCGLLAVVLSVIIIILLLSFGLTHMRMRNVILDRGRLVKHVRSLELLLDENRSSSNIDDSSIGVT
ncbi:MAG: hypothetical protein P9L92_13495 [Candidatus Electryonea clarkiae]|nr:hypothetical protein [Candidatus Electryonea clarkiae]MDP8288916.1 hypothetical protein [Candidatus Electryonea clarkiae]